jgi:protein ImuB
MAAAKLGLAQGKALADARAMIPYLDVVEADDAADTKLLAAIADWCDRFTPFVAIDPPNGLFLDITGASHLFGGERALMDAARTGIVRQGFAVALAIAGTSVAARACARYSDGVVVAAGGEPQAVAKLPVVALGADPLILHGLKRAGLKTIGQVAARGRAELTSRFGAAFTGRLDCCLGKNEAPISPRRPLPDYMAEHRFADPVATEDIISETLRSLAAALTGVLEQRGEGARILEAAFFRADGAVTRIAVETGRPVRDPAIIARLFGEKLDALADPLDPGFGFDLIRLEATLAERATHEAITFGDHANVEKDIAVLIDQFAARFGPRRIVRFFAQDTHIPEAASVTLPAQFHMPKEAAWDARSPGEPPRRPLRLLSRPEAIDVTAEIPDAPPRQFRWRRAQHLVTHAEGPERIAMEWWRHNAPMPTRDYFRVEDTDGRRFWLYRDGLYNRETTHPQWFMHGVFA